MTREWRLALDAADLAAIDALLTAGADINARDQHGQTALMNAATNGQAEVVRLLADRGADLNHRAKYGLTAVMLAVVRGHADVVRILVEAGADLTLRGSGAPGFDGKTAADLAHERGDAALLDLLHRH